MKHSTTLPADILYFVPAKKKFLKIQSGTGDNLLCEDRCMILLKDICCNTDEIVADCVKMAFNEELGTIKLMTGDELCGYRQGTLLLYCCCCLASSCAKRSGDQRI
jgi:hypothetical protein